MGKKVLIIGNHPIYYDLTKQFTQRGDIVEYIKDDGGLKALDISSYNEICLLSDAEKPSYESDNEIMGVLERIATDYEPEQNNGKRILCHLLLQSQSLLHIIHLEGFREAIKDKLEVYPFTTDELWSREVALKLDRSPITIQSNKTVHLVIFGMSQAAELVAINATHVAHFPNYNRNHTLRTRITIVDERASEKAMDWIQRYKPLFDNCHYRFINPQRNPAVTKKVSPQYNEREEFVDVEWEFVTSSPYNRLLQQKIGQWAVSPSQLLTIVVVNSDEEKGLNDALHLPNEITENAIPVYVYMQSNKAFKQICQSGKTAKIHPFGMVDEGYDINLPLVQMAKAVNYIYSQCRIMEGHDGIWKMEYAVEIDHDEKERLWSKLPSNKRMSSIYNAMSIGVKMHSVGLKEEEWEKFYDISQEEIEQLAQVEHNRWSVEELILGWRPCNDSEQLEVEANITKKEELKKHKIHYDLRAYSDLRPDASGKPVEIYDRCLSACIPLIAKESKRR